MHHGRVKERLASEVAESGAAKGCYEAVTPFALLPGPQRILTQPPGCDFSQDVPVLATASLPLHTREDAETATGKRKICGKQAQILAISCTDLPDGDLPVSSYHQACKLITRLPGSGLLSYTLTPSTCTKTEAQ